DRAPSLAAVGAWRSRARLASQAECRRLRYPSAERHLANALGCVGDAASLCANARALVRCARAARLPHLRFAGYSEPIAPRGSSRGAGKRRTRARARSPRRAAASSKGNEQLSSRDSSVWLTPSGQSVI